MKFPELYKNGSWFLILKFSRGVTQFCRISRGELVFFGISQGKVTNLKIAGEFSEKYILNPLFGFLLE